jgi:hypothetical protein
MSIRTNYSELQTKEDSLEQILRLAGLPDKFKLRAFEFNLVRAKINHLKFLLDNLELSGGEGIAGLEIVLFRFWIGGFEPSSYATYINDKDPFEILPGQIPKFRFLISLPNQLPKVTSYSIRGEQQGIFGEGGSRLLTEADLFVDFERNASADELEEETETQIVTFPNISGNIEDWLQSQDPVITIQPQDDGLVVFRGKFLGEDQSYFFVGPRGDYGVDADNTALAEHFEPLREFDNSITIEVDYALDQNSNNPVRNKAIFDKFQETIELIEASIVTETSELINDGADGIHPFIDEVEQEVITGGVYDNFQVEGNIIVATNTDGKAVFTGFNISEDYKIIYLINNSNFEIQIDNENSSSLEENQISLPNNTASVGLQGTTKFAYITKGGLNKWQIIDVFGSRYMPEHQGLDQDAAVVVGEGSVSRAKQIVNLHDTNEAITSDTLTDAELNALYRDYTVGFEVFCENAGANGIIYKNINNTTKTWRKIVLT